MSEFTQRVIDAFNAFELRTGIVPNTICIDRPAEAQLEAAGDEELGMLAIEVEAKGARNTINRIMGMNVVWDANAFAVAYVEINNSKETK